MLRIFRLKRRFAKFVLILIFTFVVILIFLNIIKSLKPKERSLLSELKPRKKFVYASTYRELPIKKSLRSLTEAPIKSKIIFQEITDKIETNTTETPTIRTVEPQNIVDGRRNTNQLFIILGNYTNCLKETFLKFYWRPSNQTFVELEKEIRSSCMDRLLSGVRSRYCIWPSEDLVGPLVIDLKTPKLQDLNKELNFVKTGGHWKPSSCISKHKLAIVIPFKDRMEHLLVLMRQLHPMLRRQELSYRIFVIEQIDEYPFNRGKLMNVGYKETLKTSAFTCFVFHDVDLIPENDLNYYGCPASPRHLSTAIDKFSYKLPYAEIFGGVEMFTKSDFEAINGFPNSYWGWGGEDDNLYKRISQQSLSLSRPTMVQGRYRMIKHAENNDKPPNRHDKLNNAYAEFESDGVSSLSYIVHSIYNESLYTHIKVDLDMEGDMVY